ncbi:hypothetical protein G4G27_01535 [Sphingomonas sp. So64.6b]|uniref:hypothetical protein n=1 Tax=Sphingomonas sp. So64.6b TaxID=2997354 RepID=UPI001603594D|nr:hypothetical protein [Sphingomonas sp. So64.6b]QNA82839.1 hypothetical protein G4G27_01535 [Sphingomonas sp. So64.6b]
MRASKILWRTAIATLVLMAPAASHAAPNGLSVGATVVAPCAISAVQWQGRQADDLRPVSVDCASSDQSFAVVIDRAGMVAQPDLPPEGGGASDWEGAVEADDIEVKIIF